MLGKTFNLLIAFSLSALVSCSNSNDQETIRELQCEVDALTGECTNLKAENEELKETIEDANLNIGDKRNELDEIKTKLQDAALFINDFTKVDEIENAARDIDDIDNELNDIESNLYY